MELQLKALMHAKGLNGEAKLINHNTIEKDGKSSSIDSIPDKVGPHSLHQNYLRHPEQTL